MCELNEVNAIEIAVRQFNSNVREFLKLTTGSYNVQFEYVRAVGSEGLLLVVVPASGTLRMIHNENRRSCSRRLV